MMDYIAGLVQRGLVSPDVAQGLVQQVADLKNQRPWETGGGAGTNSVYAPRGYGQQISEGLQAGKSFGQIAKELGVSRNTVAGQAWRLNNPGKRMSDTPQQDYSVKGESPTGYGKTSTTPRDPNYETNIPDWFVDEMKQKD